MSPEERTLAMLELHPWRPTELRQALQDFHSWSRTEAREHLRHLVDRELVSLDWHGRLVGVPA